MQPGERATSDPTRTPALSWLRVHPERGPDPYPPTSVNPHRGPHAGAVEPPTEGLVHRLALLARGGDDRGVAGLLRAQLGAGWGPERVCLDAVAPAARLLGRWWETDVCSFVEVTLGVGTLQRALRDALGGDRAWTEVEQAAGVSRGSAVFTTLAADPHTFGVAVVAEFFCQAGWSVRVTEPGRSRDAIAAVGAGATDLVGISVTLSDAGSEVGEMVRLLRRASRNPDLVILLGGCCLGDPQEAVQRAGADGWASDALGALREAARRLSPRKALLHAH